MPRSRMLTSVLLGNADPSSVFSEIVSQLQHIKLYPFYFGCDQVNKLCHVTLSMVLGDAPASNGAIGTYYFSAYLLFNANRIARTNMFIPMQTLYRVKKRLEINSRD